MSETGKVDLSVCHEWDKCCRRDGVWVYFEGRNHRHDSGIRPYMAGGVPYGPDGLWTHGRESSRDIVRVVRDGVQITPPVEYPNAGPGCDLGRYRTGEVPQIGDVVRGHGRQLDEPEKGGEYCHEGTVTRLQADDDDPSVVYVYSRVKWGGEYAARFDLLSRATPSPSCEPATGGTAGEKPVVIDGVTEDGKFPCSGCGRLVRPIGYFDGRNEFVADCECGAQTTIDRQRYIKSAVTPAAVITGPGRYRTVRFDETGEVRHLANVEAFGNGRWYGSVAKPDLAYAWTPDGNCIACESVRITGRYVPPPPKPAITMVDALLLIESQAVEKTGEYEAFAKFAKQTCREALADVTRSRPVSILAGVTPRETQGFWKAVA